MILNAMQISKKYFRSSKSKNTFEAVYPTDLALEKGKITEITGRSGCGKSTLLYMMAGLLKPSSGSVFLYDGDEKSSVNLYELNDEKLSKLRNEKTGIIPQGQTSLFSLSAIDNITAPAMLYGDSENFKERAKSLMEKLGILDLQNSRMNELSGGELRRISVARSLILNPSIIFADEPTDDLDNENTSAVLKMLREYADNGAAILLVTHEPEAEKYADVVYKMDAGKITRV